MIEGRLAARVAAVRRFNRFYTKQIGVLHEGLLESPFSLTQARVLWELAHRTRPTASELGRELGLDAGYLSRILRGFRRRRLVAATASRADRRHALLSLTGKGRAAFATLDARSQEEVAAALGKLPAAEHGRLIEAMRTVEALLGQRPEPRAPYLLRPPQRGDMGWIVHRHGVLYGQEYGWNEQFEALVATIVARFVQRHDPRRERCWIAERDGQPVGSVFLVRRSKRVAQLRLLLVEPSARGLGIGARLVSECVRFAREAGYRRITLWTNSVLVAARRLYDKAGFRRIQRARHRSFGHDLIGETWELRL
jgi:DNA-binding MarR family transcriptional regulator/GNAT superfamily N-acetyltransferase